MNRLPTELDSEFETLLSDLQGNIITHHRKNFARHHFIHFKKEHLEDALDWITKTAEAHITPADSQFEVKPEDKEKLLNEGNEKIKEGEKIFLEQAQSFAKGMKLLKEGKVEGARLIEEGSKSAEKGAKLILEGKNLVEKGSQVKVPKPMCCLYLTWEGYQALGLTHLAPPALKPNSSFVGGMRNRVAFSFEKDKYDEKIYPRDDNGQPLSIHAMLMIASDHPDFQDVAAELKLDEANPKWAYVTTQKGIMKRRSFNNERPNDKKAVEWFGFRDGVSQPLFFTGKAGSDNLAPLKIALTKDIGGQHWYSAGSFLAFLKLEQDVPQFRKNVGKIVEKIPQLNEELAAAYLMGRFRDGTSVSLSGAPKNYKDKYPENNFSYSKIHISKDTSNTSDEKGIRCPFAAHARKANPRDAAEIRVIVRRGIPYDDSAKYSNSTDWEVDGKPPEFSEEDKVGLLFMSFQSNLEEQFEYILNNWILSVNTGAQATGVDMVVGTGFNRDFSKWYLSKKWDGENANEKESFTPDDIKSCVHFKGGEYFYAPSVSFLKKIKNNSLISKGEAVPGGFKIPKIKLA